MTRLFLYTYFMCLFGFTVAVVTLPDDRSEELFGRWVDVSLQPGWDEKVQVALALMARSEGSEEILKHYQKNGAQAGLPQIGGNSLYGLKPKRIRVDK